ncbi:MAG TPA: T9SS type A sorting domain-containing protein, partial [Saprospiraceae bacterium]|nr:T9SS type A sorting domain-containing protein [Saprospiraceae bacterium]
DPGLSNLTGTFIVCPGEVKTYRVQSTDVDSISWSFPAGWQIIGNAHADSVTVRAGTTNGVLTVSGFNACGDTSLQRNLFTQNLPVISNIIGDLTPCVGDTLFYRAQQSAVQHYDWTFPPGWTLLTNEDSVAVRVSIGSQSGQVIIKGTNNCGDTTFTSAINPAIVPDASISVNNNILTINPSAQSYQWYRNSLSIPGATQNPYTATQSGSYYAKVTYATGCITYTNTVDIIISGLHDAALDKVRVFPIPAQEVVHVEGLDGDFHFDLYDLTGRIITKGQSSAGDISIAQLLVGSYFLRVEKGNREYTFLVIKK